MSKYYFFLMAISCHRDCKPSLQASVALRLNKNPILEIYFPRNTRFSLDTISEVNFSLSPNFGGSTSASNFSEINYNATALGPLFSRSFWNIFFCSE